LLVHLPVLPLRRLGGDITDILRLFRGELVIIKACAVSRDSRAKATFKPRDGFVPGALELAIDAALPIRLIRGRCLEILLTQSSGLIERVGIVRCVALQFAGIVIIEPGVWV